MSSKLSGPELAIIQPITITPAMVDSSNVPEDPNTEWDNGATYNEGDRVKVTTLHKVYESLIDGNTGQDPATTIGVAWVEVGLTNKWKAFDLSHSSQTTQADEISYTLSIGRAVSSVAVLNADSLHKLTLTLNDPIFGIVYEREVDVIPIQPESSWYSWFFGERTEVKQITLRDLPAYPAAALTVALEGGTELAVGVILVGQERDTGAMVLSGASAGIVDYSRKEADEFGDVILVERAYAKRASLPLFLDNESIDGFYELLADIRAKPCLFIAGGRRMLSIFGFIKEFDILINYANHSNASLELEGLT